MSENSFRASVFLCASATGIKLRPLIVFCGTPDGPVQDELTLHPEHNESAILAVQRKGYCDERIMLKWIDEVCAVDLRDCVILSHCLYALINAGVASVHHVTKGSPFR